VQKLHDQPLLTAGSSLRASTLSNSALAMAMIFTIARCPFIRPSAVQGGAGGVIGAVYLGMAVQAGPPEQKTIREIVADLFAGVGGAGMTGGRMALLAEQRRSSAEQCAMVAAVWLVAQAAIL